MPDKKYYKNYQKTFLSFVLNSVGSNCFRNFYATIDIQNEDVLQDGELSCAFFVSFVLSGFKMIKNPHTTVQSTIKDLQTSDFWQEINNQEYLLGDVIVWEKLDFNEKSEENLEQNWHGHIGFAISQTEAISNNSKTKNPQKHLIIKTWGEKNIPRKVCFCYRFNFEKFTKTY
jgi:hypothetical protein